MSRRSKDRSRKRKIAKVGLPPGSSVYVGEDREESISIEITSYDLAHVSVKSQATPSDLDNLDPAKYHWVQVIGIHEVETLHHVCSHFNIHPLTEEDILNTLSRPKCEIFDDYLFSGLKMIKNERPDVIVEEEQISIILKGNVTISFQELNSNFFDPIRERLNNPVSRARRKKADYLFFSLHDVIVDSYISIIDEVDEVNTRIETEILHSRSEEILARLQALKSDLLYLKRLIFPVRESVVKIMRSDGHHVEAENLKYFNDLYDHLVYVTEGIDTQREMVVNHRELYMSIMSNRMNSVMQVLTIVTTIFIPLTFIAGIYGMNFRYMPELQWRYGYFMVLGVMFVLAILMMFYFKRKRWI